MEARIVVNNPNPAPVSGRVEFTLDGTVYTQSLTLSPGNNTVVFSGLPEKGLVLGVRLFGGQYSVDVKVYSDTTPDDTYAASMCKQGEVALGSYCVHPIGLLAAIAVVLLLVGR